jgi:hypothetical protein
MWTASRKWLSLAGSVFLLLELSFVAGVRGDAQARCGACKGCLYGVDGICIPRRISYGFYETRWRRWPAEQRDRIRESEESSTGLDDVPIGDVPQATEEGDPLPSLPGRPLHRSDSREMSPAKERLDSYQRDLHEDPFRDDPISPTDTTQAIRQNNAISRTSYARFSNDVRDIEFPSSFVSPGPTPLVSSAPETISNAPAPSQIARQMTPMNHAVRPGIVGHRQFNPLRIGETIPPTMASSIGNSPDANLYSVPAYDTSMTPNPGITNERNPLRK